MAWNEFDDNPCYYGAWTILWNSIKIVWIFVFESGSQSNVLFKGLSDFDTSQQYLGSSILPANLKQTWQSLAELA